MYAKRQIVSSGSRASDAANKTYEAQEVQQTKKTNLMTRVSRVHILLTNSKVILCTTKKNPLGTTRFKVAQQNLTV